MKLIMENWRIYEQEILLEQEFEQFFNENFGTLEEGPVDWVLGKANDIKNTVINVIDGMKNWTNEKIKGFVKFMANKLIQFIKLLRQKGIFKKYKARAETQAVKLLLTNKHIDLAVMIFSALAKLTGGFVVDKVVEAPKIIKKLTDILNNPMAIKDLLGDVSDVVEMIKKFIEYRKDKTSFSARGAVWDDFGGLAEKLEKLK